MMASVRKRWRCALVIWLVAYPLITLLSYFLEPSVGSWPLPLRTLLVSSIVVPIMALWLVPALAARVSAFLEIPAPKHCSCSRSLEKADSDVGEGKRCESQTGWD